MSNLYLYGFSSVEILGGDKKKVIANEPKVFFNHFNRKPKVEKKENDIKFEEPEIHENIKVLNPVLYMFKYFKPSYFNVKKIQCSYNKNSLSIMNVTMGEYEIPKIKQNLEYVTPSGNNINNIYIYIYIYVCMFIFMFMHILIFTYILIFSI